MGGIPAAREGSNTPLRSHFSNFVPLIFECLFEWFSVGFGSHFGSLLGPFWDPFSICFPMKKYIDFPICFWSPFVRMLNPRTLQNEALAYTKRLFSKKRQFRATSDFPVKYTSTSLQKGCKMRSQTNKQKQCSFALIKTPNFY